MPHREKVATFKVFLVESWIKQSGDDITQVLTWGDGKYQFIGDWTGQLLEDHTYRVRYVQQAGHNNHHYNNLIILEWEEIN